MLIVACLSSEISTWGGCHDSCNFNLLYGGKKANPPALVCLDSEHERYGVVIVALKFNQICNMQELSCSTETNADYVKIAIMWIFTQEVVANDGDAHQLPAVASCCWSRPWVCCTREGLKTALDTWFLAEDLCDVQLHACRYMLYLIFGSRYTIFYLSFVK